MAGSIYAICYAVGMGDSCANSLASSFHFSSNYIWVTHSTTVRLKMSLKNGSPFERGKNDDRIHQPHRDCGSSIRCP